MPIPTTAAHPIPLGKAMTTQFHSMLKHNHSDLQQQCARTALFLNGTDEGWRCLIFIFGIPVTIALICALYRIVDEDSISDSTFVRGFTRSTEGVTEADSAATESTGNSSSTGVPVVRVKGGKLEEQEDEERPPPYAPESSSSVANTVINGTLEAAGTTSSTPGAKTPVQGPKTKRKPSEAFVSGTILFFLIIFMLVLVALTIQSFTYCDRSSILEIGWRTTWWIIYSCLCVSATIALNCWVILVRDLWGKDGKRKLQINPFWLSWVFFLPVIAIPAYAFVGSRWVLQKGHMAAVWGVEMCQKWCCGSSILEEEEEELGDLEEGRGLTGDEAGGSGDGEEMLGLITGHASDKH